MGILIFGVIFIGCGVITLVKKDTVARHERMEAQVTGIILIVFGMLAIVGTVIENHRMMLTSIFLPASAFCIFVPIKVALQMKKCNCLVVAKCVEYKRYSGGKGQSSYAPVFRYTYGGMQYERQTPVGYRLKKIQQMYQIGQCYQIFINADCPEMCAERKNIPFVHILCMLIGAGMLFLYLILMIGL